MIQRIDGIGPPERPGGGPRPGSAAGRADRRVEIGLVVAFVLVGASFGAAALLRIVAQRGTTVTALPTATRSAGLEHGVELGIIDPARIEGAVAWLADPLREGRDTPSRGLREAQRWVAAQLDAAGIAPPPARIFAAGGPGPLPEDIAPGPDAGPGQRGSSDSGSAASPSADALARRAHGYVAGSVGLGSRALEAPVPDACGLWFEGAGELVLDEDFAPLVGSSTGADGAEERYGGEVTAEAAFAGHAIDNTRESYDDLAARDLAGRIAVVLPGEPDIGFGGPEEVTAESSVWNKLDALAGAGAAGALVIAERPGPISFRASRARWIPPSFDRERSGLPALVITHAVAERLLGVSVDALVARSAEAPLVGAGAPSGLPEVRMAARTARGPRRLVNVLGFIEGSDPSLAIVVTAHLDHIGVGPRGRIGAGANDNASGVAAALELARALAASEPLAPSVLFAFTSGEEDGLLGARALARDLSGGLGRVALCLNLDMVGHGPGDGCVLLRGAPGRGQRALDRRLERAVASRGHGLASVLRVDDDGFFTRSDHFAFFERGVPSVFLFQGWPLGEGVYHTWRDVPEGVDAGKVARVAKLAALVLATYRTDR